jgi:hypothetical protein
MESGETTTSGPRVSGDETRVTLGQQGTDRPAPVTNALKPPPGENVGRRRHGRFARTAGPPQGTREKGSADGAAFTASGHGKCPRIVQCRCNQANIGGGGIDRRLDRPKAGSGSYRQTERGTSGRRTRHGRDGSRCGGPGHLGSQNRSSAEAPAFDAWDSNFRAGCLSTSAAGGSML